MNYSIHSPREGNKVNVYKTYSNKNTCPDSCALKNNGCYAENFHVNLHWQKVTEGKRGSDWQSLLDSIKALPTGATWRHNIAGDLVGQRDKIDGRALVELTRASIYRKKRGFTYTHYPLNAHNSALIKAANKQGFTVNTSADNVGQAVKRFKDGLPTVVVLPIDAPNIQTIDGVKVVACPNDKTDRVKCGNCAHSFCGNSKRDFVIGFRAHGTKKKQADIIARSI